MILSNDSRLAQRWFGSPHAIFSLLPCFFALLVLSVDLFVSLERFALELGPSDLDFACPDCPRSALVVVLGSQNGVIWKASGECTGFVASIDFSCDFCVFSQWVFDRLSTQFSITSSSICAFDRRWSCWLKPRKTLAGATKIKFRR